MMVFMSWDYLIQLKITKLGSREDDAKDIQNALEQHFSVAGVLSVLTALEGYCW